jgi:filamentous hemagglutinin family protein
MTARRTSDMQVPFKQAVLLIAVIQILGATASAGPEGATVVQGTAQFNQSGNYTAIHVSDKAIINYNSFDIARPETVEFIQPGASASVLNRILSATPTVIDGTVLANGRVFFVNPAGVLFGESAQVNVTQLVASALNISDADFTSGRYEFQGGHGEVINRGNLSAEQVALIGKRVSNLGKIDCPGGAVVLVAGDRVFLGEPGTDLLVEIDPSVPSDDVEPAEGSGVLNEGSVEVEGGSILLAAAGDVYSRAISNVGKLSASTDEGDAGTVRVVAPDGTVVSTGSITAASESGKGGSVQVLGDRVGLLENSEINVSGASGGGSAFIGGDYRGQGEIPTASRTVVGPDAAIQADATEDGDGGKVVVWSEEVTYFAGSISARGGEQGGDGGVVEVSGTENLGFYGQVDTQAPQGDLGTLLLDPTDIVVATSDGSDGYSGGGILFDDVPASEPWNVSPAALNDAGATVLLQARRDITFSDPVALDTPAAGLTAQAGRSILVNADITTNGGPINMTADGDIRVAGEGTVALSTGEGAGDVTLGGALELGSSLLVMAGTGDVTFQGTIDDDGIPETNSSLAVDSGGTTRFNAAVGGSHPIETLFTDAPGTTQINGNVTTSGAAAATQVYSDPVVLTNSVTLSDTGTDGISFGDTVSGDGEGPWSLTVVTTNPEAQIWFNDTVTLDGGIRADAVGDIHADQLTSATNNIELRSTEGDLVLYGAINADRDQEGYGGGVSLIADSGRVQTGDGILEVAVTGYSDGVRGVDLPYGDGKAAIRIDSGEPLLLGSNGALVARGTYGGGVREWFTPGIDESPGEWARSWPDYGDSFYGSSIDDRAAVGFSTDAYYGGVPMDVAIYLRSSASGIVLNSPVTVPDGATVVLDAYDTLAFGGSFIDNVTPSSFPDTSRLELVSRSTTSLATEADRDRFPYTVSYWGEGIVTESEGPDWFTGYSCVLRGGESAQFLATMEYWYQYLIPVWEVSGRKYLDYDGDGEIDEGDTGLAGVTIFVDMDDSGTLTEGDLVTVTGGDGGWSFLYRYYPGEEAGYYDPDVVGRWVYEVVPSGYMQTLGEEGYWIHGDGSQLGLNFANARLLPLPPPVPVVIVPVVVPPAPIDVIRGLDEVRLAEAIVGPIVPPHPECVDVKQDNVEVLRKCQVACNLFSTDVSLVPVAEDIVSLNNSLKAGIREVLPRLGALSQKWPRLRPGDLPAVEQVIEQDPALRTWLHEGVEFTRLLSAKLGRTRNDSVERFLLEYLAGTADESVQSFVQGYLKARLDLIAEASSTVARAG